MAATQDWLPTTRDGIPAMAGAWITARYRPKNRLEYPRFDPGGADRRQRNRLHRAGNRQNETARTPVATAQCKEAFSALIVMRRVIPRPLEWGALFLRENPLLKIFPVDVSPRLPRRGPNKRAGFFVTVAASMRTCGSRFALSGALKPVAPLAERTYIPRSALASWLLPVHTTLASGTEKLNGTVPQGNGGAVFPGGCRGGRLEQYAGVCL